MYVPDHPVIRSLEATGYPPGVSDEETKVYCGECGRELHPDDEDVYECRTHAILCEDCLKVLHKKYVW